MVVATTTFPGYRKRVAVTLMWQKLVQEIDAGRLELSVGEIEILGSGTVCMEAGPGTISVVVEINIAEM